MCAKGWNRPSAESSRKCRHGTSAVSIFKWLSSCAAVALLLVVGYYFSTEKKENKPFEVKPAKQGWAVAAHDHARGSALAEVSPSANKAATVPVRTAEAQDVPVAVVSNATSGVQPEGGCTKDKRLFTNAMDQLLAMVAPRNAGDSVPPLPIVDGMEFSEEEERKILEQLTADDRDSDAVLDRKEFVQALRNEYFELKKRGWTFVEYIRALEAKANLDNEVLEESQRIHETIFNDSSISDEVYAKTLETINKMLADRGIKPIKPPPIENDEEN